jgi:succinyl-CoA synthetase beta subunit
MYIHEYQAKAILAARGVRVPAGHAAASPEAAARAFDQLDAGRAVVKAQVHAGGRGKAGGIVPVETRAEAETAARRLLGTRLVTAQTGPAGRPVRTVLVEEALDIRREFYAAISLDRAAGRPRAVASARGGMDVEALGRTDHDALVTVLGDVARGLTPYQARQVAARLDVDAALMRPLADLLLHLGRTLVECDASLIELNPLALVAGGGLVAADVKMTLDDNALPRHPDLADLRDPDQEDPREAEAARHDLAYVGLGGSVGCMVNGAGLAMATLDLLRLHGGEPANFLDVGGNATAEKVAAALGLIAADGRVRVILVNIFGGIVRCDLIAEGILDALRKVELTVPLVVRLEGNRAAEGRAALAAGDLPITAAASLDDAARLAVEMARA